MALVFTEVVGDRISSVVKRQQEEHKKAVQDSEENKKKDKQEALKIQAKMKECQ